MSDRAAQPGPPGSLEGQAVVVTGAAGGIGAACATTLATRGAAVVMSDVDSDRLESAVRDVRAAGGRATGVPCDVTDTDAVELLARRAVEQVGRLDGAVLAAGVAMHTPFLELTVDQWNLLTGIHLTGAFACLRALAGAMGGAGSLVCVSSTVAHGGGPAGQAHYVAAKAGVLGLVRAAARELGPRGIRVNAVSPGFTETGLNDGLFSEDDRAGRASRAPLGRVAVPDDVARVAAFLLGPDSCFVTGEEIKVDGGANLG